MTVAASSFEHAASRGVMTSKFQDKGSFMNEATASLAGIPLTGEASACAGAAFRLNRLPWQDAHATIDGWEVSVREGCNLVVARGGVEQGYDDAYRAGLLRAQQGLDLLSARGIGDLSIKGFDEEHVVWWAEPELVIRVVSITPYSIRVGLVSLEVRDAAGNLVPPTEVPPPNWHESFRYFRLSQTTDDLFDAYRNAYLALESILSDICPQKMRANGKPDEGEGTWFSRALTAADQVAPLSRFAPPGTADPKAYLLDELYVRMRSAMSHAKSGRQVLLPRNQAEREQITASLQRLVSLYLGLMENHLGMRRLGGAMTADAFRKADQPLLRDAVAFASNDESPFDPKENAANPAGGRLVILPPAGPVATDEAFVASRLFAADAADVELPFIARLGTTDGHGIAQLVTTLEGRLVLGPAKKLEALIGVRGANAGQPKTRFSF